MTNIFTHVASSIYLQKVLTNAFDHNIQFLFMCDFVGCLFHRNSRHHMDSQKNLELLLKFNDVPKSFCCDIRTHRNTLNQDQGSEKVLKYRDQRNGNLVFDILDPPDFHKYDSLGVSQTLYSCIYIFLCVLSVPFPSINNVMVGLKMWKRFLAQG